MSKPRFNTSKTFLLPLLSEIIGIKREYFKYLKNTYMFDDMNLHKNCLYILHDFSFKNPEFTNYEHQLIKNELFVELIDLEDDKVLYIFKMPEEYLHEYNCLINGKYSSFGTDAKEMILSFFSHIYEGNLNVVPFLLKTKQILFKDKLLKKKLEEDLKVKLSDDDELKSIINIENETFELSKYKNGNNMIKKN